MKELLAKMFIYFVLLVWSAPMLIIAGAGLVVIVGGIIKCIKN